MAVRAGPMDELVSVRGESFVVSGHNGDLSPRGDQGFFVRDTRFLDQFEVRVDGSDLRSLSFSPLGAHGAEFHGYLPPPGRREVDPTVLVTRRRAIQGGLHEDIDLVNAGDTEVTHVVTIRLGTDFAYVFDVRHARILDRVLPQVADDLLVFRRHGGEERTQVRFVRDGTGVTPELHTVEGAVDVRIPVTVPAHGATRICIEVTAHDVFATTAPDTTCPESVRPAPAAEVGDGPTIRCSDGRFARLVRRSIADLEGLIVADPDEPIDRFAAAGSPWFLTLFGRDSLWAALMAMPYDLSLGLGTLRTLARRQGAQVDTDTEEAPGKILHEVRRGALAERGDLPPNYYGSIDATPLFVIVAHEAWRWGADPAEIARLIPNVEAALDWMAHWGDSDGDGFLEHARPDGRGLVNQGWKDSVDGIRFRDGTVALAPMALSEVQGYAYAAARAGADLLDAFEHDGADRWRAWADTLAERFRERFWVEDEHGRYPAVALDRDKTPVDSVASNMGHLLFTGILDAEESQQVADRLSTPGMSSGWGLRTLAAGSGGFNPLSYHCGSIWPHDTAIAVWGLSRCGHDAAAARLLRGLVAAAPRFRYRLPELFSGLGRSDAAQPVPYPTACRPQAWAAGAALLAVRSVLGVEPDIPSRRLRFNPMQPAPFERLELRGLQLAGVRLDIRFHGDALDVEIRDAEVDVEVQVGS
jgi:glycogen debranching enzyme